jgi:hypothetical protein
LLRRVSRGNRGIVMKTFLNFFRQLDEIKFRNSRFGSKHNSVRLDSADCYILVLFAVNRFEIVTESGRRETQN